MHNSPPSRLRALAGVVAGATAISFAPIFAVLAGRYDDLSPIVTAFWRTALAAAVLGTVLVVLPRHRQAVAPGHWPLLLLPGVFFAVDLSCWHISMTHISAGLSTLLGNLSVVLVPLLGWLLFRAPYNRANIPATLIALTGGALVCIVPDEKTLDSLGVSGNNYALGNALAASTAVAYASYQLAIHRARRRYGVLTVMCVSTTTTAALLFALALLSGARIVPSDGRAWGALVALALVSHCLGQGLIAWGLGRLPAHLVALTLLWQPVCSALLSVVVLGQSMSPLQVFGCLLVISGLALVSLRGRTGRQARRRSAAAPG